MSHPSQERSLYGFKAFDFEEKFSGRRRVLSLETSAPVVAKRPVTYGVKELNLKLELDQASCFLVRRVLDN